MSASVERARPLLGTLVRIRCRGLPLADANARIDLAFAEVARVHDLMSFHQAESDVSRLNSMAHLHPVQIDARTFTVIRFAIELAERSAGLFDIAIAEYMVALGALPKPVTPDAPAPTGNWRDIELIDPDRVRFHRPLWIDLGGIAKGYAVDLAMAKLGGDERIDWWVNAGGDMRVAGPAPKQTLLDNPAAESDPMPVLELENASLASSGGTSETARPGAHVNGRTRQPIAPRHFVSVVAERCMIADALTKVVLADADEADAILKEYGATAFLHRPAQGWVTLGTGS